MFFGGIALIALGSIYIWKPTLFRRSMWLRTSIAIRLLSEPNYIRYMKGLGVLLIVIGLAFVLHSLFGAARPFG